MENGGDREDGEEIRGINSNLLLSITDSPPRDAAIAMEGHVRQAYPELCFLSFGWRCQGDEKRLCEKILERRKKTVRMP